MGHDRGWQANGKFYFWNCGDFTSLNLQFHMCTRNIDGRHYHGQNSGWLWVFNDCEQRDLVRIVSSDTDSNHIHIENRMYKMHIQQVSSAFFSFHANTTPHLGCLAGCLLLEWSDKLWFHLFQADGRVQVWLRPHADKAWVGFTGLLKDVINWLNFSPEVFWS